MALLGRRNKDKQPQPAEIQVSPLRLSVLKLMEMLATSVAPQSVRDHLPAKILAKSLRDSLGLMTEYQLASGVYAMAQYSATLVQMIPEHELQQIQQEFARENGGSNRQS